MNPYRSSAPDRMLSAGQPWWRRAVTRVWRTWLVFLYRPYRERAVRCKVCGRPFEWERRNVTVPPMCPACLQVQQGEPVVWVCARCAPVAAKPLMREVPAVVLCPLCGAHCHRGVTAVVAVRMRDLDA